MVKSRVSRCGVGAVVALVAGLIVLVGCGESETPKASKGTTTGARADVKGDAKAAAPAAKQAWADRVFDIYVSAFKETNAALEKEPLAVQALPKLQAIRDKAIEALVPLGREREAMDAPAKAEADRQLRLKLMMGFDSSDTYKTFAKLFNETYNITKMKTEEEKAFQKLLAGMNIITQYASFELLKKQEPKEAERLGIK